MKEKSMIRIFSLVALLMVSSGSAFSQPQSSTEFFNGVARAIQTKDGRAMLRNAISSWSPEQRATFDDQMVAMMENYAATSLPQRVDRYETITSLRIHERKIFMDSTLSREFDRADLVNLKPVVEQTVCTTPQQALMLILGYDYLTRYYDEQSKFLTQIEVTPATCGY